MDKDQIKLAIQEVFGLETQEDVQNFKEVLPTLVDMANDWKVALKFGKWLTGLATFISIIFGIWAAVKDLFKH